MRKYKFKAIPKAPHKDRVFGSLVQTDKSAWIVPEEAGVGGLAYEVFPETVCQSMTLDSGLELYEGDICSFEAAEPEDFDCIKCEGPVSIKGGFLYIGSFAIYDIVTPTIKVVGYNHNIESYHPSEDYGFGTRSGI